MVRLEWNALRVGDQVFVHDPSDADLRLIPVSLPWWRR